MSKKIIALDADGVLLDYNLAYASLWERVFGEYPRERDKNAYWALDRWDVKRLSGRQLEKFRACYDEAFWSSIPAVAGAVEACQLLKEAGYELVCVTALKSCYQPARLQNLKMHGFPIDRVYTVEHTDGGLSPKASVLRDINPSAFVDDYFPYLLGVPREIHQALIMRDPSGSPNQGDLMALPHSLHSNLLEFARWWISQ